MEQMDAMMRSGKFNPMQAGDPVESMMDMVVEQSKLSDEIYFKYGVDDDEFNQAMVSHNLMHDPEIQRTLMANMQRLGMGGGGGGGFGF